jgi:CRISPR-associated protein Csb2
MPNYLCVKVRFLDPEPAFHGQRDAGEPEWPPSPLRLLQAIVDAAVSRWRGRQFTDAARPFLQFLERLNQPEIVAPAHIFGIPFRIAVPNNDLDAWAEPISKGDEPKKTPSQLKAMKLVRPVHLEGDTVHYLYPLPDGDCPHFDVLKTAARSITHLGWGIDMACGDASIFTPEQVAGLKGVRWNPSPVGGTPLRVPRAGTLDDLIRKHTDFLNRVSDEGFRPVPPLREFDVVHYRSQHEPMPRSYRVFELRNLDGSRFRYSHRKLIHIAGMVRHLAIEAMSKDPPRGVPDDWVETFIAGHAAEGAPQHRQLSYLPLPSVGMEHTNPGIRRVMIVAPTGDDPWLEHLARRLGGQQLKALNERTPEFGVGENGQPNPGPLLVPLPRTGDGVTNRYTRPASVWASFTPVILPGHDDHKPEKTRKLILKSLTQAGIEQPCEVEWSAFSRFRKSYPAHKYGKDRQLQGYIRPDHLLSQTAVHLTLKFHDGTDKKIPVKIPGPITLGAGRHCGLGLFAAVE